MVLRGVRGWAGHRSVAGRVRRVLRTGESGASAPEVAAVFAAVLLLSLAGFQIGWWFQARSMCQAAAQAGARAGAALGAPAGAGSAAASAYLTATAGGTVSGARVAESRTTAVVTVTCSGSALSVMPLPGFPLAVGQSANAGLERFTHR